MVKDLNIPEPEKEKLTAFAHRIVDKGFSIPVIFYLEMTKYMAFIGSQALVFFGPIVTAFVRSDPYYKMAELLEERKNIEFLLLEIERLEAENKSREARKKAELSAEKKNAEPK